MRDPRPALYQYEVLHGPPDDRMRATGVLCRLAVDPWPLPQSSLPGPGGWPAPDAQGLAGSTGDAGTHGASGKGPNGQASDPPLPADEADDEPVLLGFEDPRGWVEEVLSSNAFDEVARFWDGAGAEHRLWRIDRTEGIAEAVAQFEDRPLRLLQGGGLLRQRLSLWHAGRRDADAAVLALLTTAEGAPWRGGLVASPRDESRPRPWQELAGDPGRAQWRTPSL